MRRIRIIEHISLDGVIQASGGPKEDGDYSTYRPSGPLRTGSFDDGAA
jgi:hypothetical protein